MQDNLPAAAAVRDLVRLCWGFAKCFRFCWNRVRVAVGAEEQGSPPEEVVDLENDRGAVADFEGDLVAAVDVDLAKASVAAVALCSAHLAAEATVGHPGAAVGLLYFLFSKFNLNIENVC